MILRISELAVLAYLSVSQKSDSKRRLSLFHKSAHLSNVVGGAYLSLLQIRQLAR